MESPDDIVGHKTMRDGSHVPLLRAEAEAMLAAAEAAEKKRAETMPDTQSAINAMFQAWYRLKELGWREAIYCPKDGTRFEVIEPGSTGIHRVYYDGEWPKGSWWAEDDEVWPSRPILFRLYPEDQAKHDAKLARLRNECNASATADSRPLAASTPQSHPGDGVGDNKSNNDHKG